MKKNGSKKALSVIFISVIVFFMFAILITFILSNFFGIYPSSMSAAETQPDITQSAFVDWSVDYPFSGDYGFEFASAEKEVEENAAKTSKIKKYEDFIRGIEDRIDYYSTNLLIGRMHFVELNAFFNKLIGMNIVSGTDSVVVMRNGYLTFQSYEVDMDYAIKSTDYFHNWLTDKGIDFLYVQCPSKENPLDNQLPYGIEDYNNQNADNLLAGLEEAEVPFLDLRQSINDSFDNYYSCFFKTDHHWTPETGVWAAGQIAQNLNNRYGYDFSKSIGDLDNYNVDVYEDYCFGSQGKKATLRYADPEDISLIYPKTQTDFTVQFVKEETFEGRFEDTLIDKSVFDKIDYYNITTYATYFRGNHSFTNIRNNRITDGKRMIYIIDSFCASVIPFLATETEEMLVLDLRGFNGSITKVIEEFSPDAVVVAYNPTLFSANTRTYGVFNFE
ncbi:MAG: hypothetical protein IKJ69_06035 [Clostridia bacterium]|nr:hypothetical protein [Clostridia bacterium]